MSAHQPLHLLQQSTNAKLASLTEKSPVLAGLAQAHAPVNQDDNATSLTPVISPQLKKSEKLVYEQLSNEERESVFVTLQAWLAIPLLPPETTMRLYIEQQLGSLINFNVSSESGNLVLPLLQTVMSAMPHIKRSPHDSLDQHAERLEAGLARDRSFFGWINNNDNAKDGSDDEKYGVYLPLHLLPNWQAQRDDIIKQYKKANILICNPFTKKLVVARCIGWWPASPSHPTSGGTPEVITSAQVWHPNSLGRVVMFFISSDNLDQPLNLGAIAFHN